MTSTGLTLWSSLSVGFSLCLVKLKFESLGEAQTGIAAGFFQLKAGDVISLYTSMNIEVYLSVTSIYHLLLGFHGFLLVI